MTTKTTHYTKEFRVNAVKLANDLGSVAEAARSLGISDKNLYNWKRKIVKDGKDAFPGKGKLTPEQEKIRSLERELKQAKLELEFLKKASTYFAQKMS